MSKRKVSGKPAGAKRHAGGRPVTTGSWSTPLISFRAPSKAAYDELAAEAARSGTSVSLIAKARVFPKS